MLYECLRARSASQAFQGAQEDAQEFLTYLVDQLHEELLRCTPARPNDTSSRFRPERPAVDPLPACRA